MTATRPARSARSARSGVVALRFEPGALHALDQTQLPWRELELELRSADEVAEAIGRLAIRGAPLIGVAAAYGVALDLARDPNGLDRACHTLRTARPTAVNLAVAVDRVHHAARAHPADAAAAALNEARTIEREEEAASAAIAAHGADLLTAAESGPGTAAESGPGTAAESGPGTCAGARRILTHCNTGALAAPGRGTALAVVAELADRGMLEKAIATESRPLLQGARLTVYELSRLGIPHELVVDSAAPGLIAADAADAVIVGCDRVAANGDVANKVGTYGLALAAHAAGIPFVVAGPTSTVDFATPTGADIVIEERDANEVRNAAGQRLTLETTPCRNPAFDVTPAHLVTALVTERGALRKPDAASLATLAP